MSFRVGLEGPVVTTALLITTAMLSENPTSLGRKTGCPVSRIFPQISARKLSSGCCIYTTNVLHRILAGARAFVFDSRNRSDHR